MKIGILKELTPGESRVAAVPETVEKMVKTDMEVYIESGAGQYAYFSDSDYEKAGAKIAANAQSVFDQAEVIVKVNPPMESEINFIKANTTLIAPIFPVKNSNLVTKLNAKKITTFALDLLPRIARAQSMDILSSMSNLAGYKSIILAATHLGKIFPMMMTAAGTIQPAKIIVIGVGVAGLQAIATAKRLGGVVIAFDTRPPAGEQAKSLGADFVSLETSHEQAQDTGGYAKELSAEFYAEEQNIIRQYIKAADVIITTALIPSKRAPLLITEAMVKEMKPGSVIVDLSTEHGGNCELSETGKIVIKYDITIIGLTNLPSSMPVHASQLYAKNIFNFLIYIAPQLTNKQFDLSDDIVKNCLIMSQGEILRKG